MLEKSKLFCLSTTAWIWREREKTDRKEETMEAEELVRKDFIKRITLELKLAR